MSGCYDAHRKVSNEKLGTSESRRVEKLWKSDLIQSQTKKAVRANALAAFNNEMSA